MPFQLIYAYFVSIPAGVVQRLDKIRRSFLSQGNKARTGYHPFKWKVLIPTRNREILEMKKLKNPSKALKMKWLWRYTHESHSQRKCDQLKYGEMDGWVTKEANNPCGVTVWRSIRNWWPILLSHTIIAFNDGRRNCLLERQVVR